MVATLVNYNQQTEDIVQGLPKIEELVEARKPKIKAYLTKLPGILLGAPKTFRETESWDKKSEDYTIMLRSDNAHLKTKHSKQFKQVAHSLFLKNNIILTANKTFKLFKIPKLFQPQLKINTNEYLFKNINNEILINNGKRASSKWIICKNSPLSFFSPETAHCLKLAKQALIFSNKKNDLIVQTINKDFLFFENLNPIASYEIPLTVKLISAPGNFIDIGEPLTEGIIDIHELLTTFFNYHQILDGTVYGTIRSLNKIQIILVNSIQSIYHSQGVDVSSKHIEIIVKQMTNNVVIRNSGDTPLLPGEQVRLGLINEITQAFKGSTENETYNLPQYEPVLTSSTNAALNKDGVLSSAGFQETKKVLTKAAIAGSTDWLRGLKESIIIGRLIPAGSTFLNYKNYLDTVYLFKK
jgi:hypothetical protein